MNFRPRKGVPVDHFRNDCRMIEDPTTAGGAVQPFRAEVLEG